MRAELLRTDASRWEIGPYHGAIPGPMRLLMSLDGEVITSVEVEAGYLHRGIEKTFELHSWQSSPTIADRLDPEAAVFGELALCMAVEEIAEIEVPPRAQAIRAILCELTRVSAHLGFVVRMARSVGAETMVHYALRDREKLLDLFELLTGARFALNFLRFGGVRTDITEGFIERVLESCDLIQVRLREYNDLFTYNHAFLRRATFVGALNPDLVARHGVTGPAARAAGVRLDVRKAHPYSGYQGYDFAIPMPEPGAEGGAHDRFVLRLREIGESLAILRQACDPVPLGEFQIARIEKEFAVPEGEGYSRVESPRGLMGCHVVADGTARPARVQFRTPTAAHLAVIPGVAAGARVEDLPVLLASLDLGLAEADR